MTDTGQDREMVERTAAYEFGVVAGRDIGTRLMAMGHFGVRWSIGIVPTEPDVGVSQEARGFVDGLMDAEDEEITRRHAERDRAAEEAEAAESQQP